MEKNKNQMKIEMIQVVMESNKNQDDMVSKYLAKGGNVTQCGTVNPSSNNKPKGAKDKSFVAQKEYQTSNRNTSMFQKQTEKELDIWYK